MRRKTYGLICGIVAAAVSGGVAQANQCVWVGSGSGGGKNVRFSVASNWSCTGGATAGTGDDYFFDSSMTVNGTRGLNTNCTLANADITVNSITIRNTYTSTITGNSTAITVNVTGAWTQSTGTFSGGTGDLTVGSLALSGGTFTAGSGTLNVTSDLSLGGGTFTASTGNISIGGSFSQTAGTFTGASGTVSITGNLAMTGGTYTGAAGSATVGGNVNVSPTVTNGGDPTLVGYWAFDDTPNHTADSSANGNSLTWSGTSTFPRPVCRR